MNRIALLLVLASSSCMNVSDSTVVRVADSAGLHDVKPTGLAPMSCGKGDVFRSHFRARNVNNQPVEGSVCCGWFKDCTVRFE